MDYLQQFGDVGVDDGGIPLQISVRAAHRLILIPQCDQDVERGAGIRWMARTGWDTGIRRQQELRCLHLGQERGLIDLWHEHFDVGAQDFEDNGVTFVCISWRCKQRCDR